MTYRILPMLAVSMIGIGLAIAAPVGAYFWSRDPGPAQTMERLTAERLLPEDINRPHTVKSRLNSFGPSARTRLKKAFLAAPLPYPPAEIVLLGLKQERLLELYGRAPGMSCALSNHTPLPPGPAVWARNCAKEIARYQKAFTVSIT